MELNDEVSPMETNNPVIEIVSDSDDEMAPPAPVPSPTNCTKVDIILLKSLQTFVLGVRPLEERPISTARNFSDIFWPTTRTFDSNLQGQLASGSANLPEDDVQVLSEDESSSEDINIIAPSRPIIRSTFRFNFNFPPFTRETPQPLEPSISKRRYDCTQDMPQPSLIAQQVANRVIKYARCARNIHEEDLYCLNCGLLPVSPVTGICGHTRCAKCIEIMKHCPCGNESTQKFSVNILIRELLKRVADNRNERQPKGVSPKAPKRASSFNRLLNGGGGWGTRSRQAKRITQPYPVELTRTYQHYVPMSPRARFAHAVELLHSGRHRDAAPHLALAAASSHSDLQVARTLLAQVIMVLSDNRDPRNLTRELNYFVRHISSITWITPKDMECILCCEIFTSPVTTPCGHMFCRICIEKALDYWRRCPLCLRELLEFKLAEAKDTVFVKGALATINSVMVPTSMEEEGVVPIFVCTVAYPSIPCPLFIFDPRYWRMIRRVLESGSRRFGMVAMDREKKYADYGTVLEVRDCVRLEDGRSILSTVGLSRFRVMERCVRDGCEVAHIQPIFDLRPADMIVEDLKLYANQTMFKAMMWFSGLDSRMVADIETAFGPMPTYEINEGWWESRDGPTWLWWLVAVLPLRTEIKLLILSTECLLKRILAVARTLEAVADVKLTTLAPGQCLTVTMPGQNPSRN